MKENITVHNLEQTKEFAQSFANRLHQGDLVLLNGDLGAGKTTFTRFVFEALGVKGIVNSPTFAIMKVYDSEKGALYHFDTYRITVEEAIEAGFDEIFSNMEDKIVFVEWSDNIKSLLPKAHFVINLQYVTDTEREIEVITNE